MQGYTPPAQYKQPKASIVSGLLLASQAKQPERLFDVLLTTAVKESWIILLIHFHTAIFFGLILLASGYDGVTSIVYLAIHLSASLFSSVLLMLLIRQTPEQLIKRRKLTVYGLSTADVLTSLGWGISIMLFFISSSFDQASTLVVLLLAAGISSAALSAKLLHILILGRVLVFLPTIIYLISQQPPDWLLHTTSLGLSFGVCVGVGYAIHVQLLREAFALVELSETQDQIVREAEFRERFLKSITHDLRQPLNSLKLHFRSLRKTQDHVDTSAEAIAIDSCLASANQIMRNVSQLVWVSDALPPPNLKPVSLNVLLNTMVATTKAVAERKGLQLSMVTTSAFCMAEQGYLERVLGNLVDNAIEYTASGRILLGVRRRQSRGTIEIQVLDTGRGIEQSQWPMIFENYQRLSSNSNPNAEHLGLGLSIVKNICEAMGGKVNLQSKIGKGSCFGVEFKEAANHRSHTDSSAQVRSLVIVEDDPEYGETLKQCIEACGARVKLFATKNEINELFEDGLPPSDAFIFDYHLSHSLTGLELAKLTPRSAQRVLLSNFDTPQLRTAANQQGLRFFPKPQSSAAIHQLLSDQFGLEHSNG